MLYNFNVYPNIAPKRSHQIHLNHAKELIGVEPNLQSN